MKIETEVLSLSSTQSRLSCSPLLSRSRLWVGGFGLLTGWCVVEFLAVRRPTSRLCALHLNPLMEINIRQDCCNMLVWGYENALNQHPFRTFPPWIQALKKKWYFNFHRIKTDYHGFVLNIAIGKLGLDIAWSLYREVPKFRYQYLLWYFLIPSFVKRSKFNSI